MAQDVLLLCVFIRIDKYFRLYKYNRYRQRDPVEIEIKLDLAEPRFELLSS